MSAFDLLSANQTLFSAIIAIVGLLVGSFLNVVIYRLPIMMQRGYTRDCRDFLQLEPLPIPEEDVFNLVYPLSRCPFCKTPVKPHQNIPVVSYIFLGGKCAHCTRPIALRYPLIEALTGLLSFLVAWRFGLSAQTGVALFLTWSLVALSFIDLDQQLLPDSITLPMLWLGLNLSIFELFTDSHDSIIGATAGYLLLWGVYQTFKLLTGKEGMGFGDFKLLAMFGAWLGWQFLPLIILLSSLTGTVIGITLIILRRHHRDTPIPFGPYLAIAGWIALMWGSEINHLYLRIAGF